MKAHELETHIFDKAIRVSMLPEPPEGMTDGWNRKNPSRAVAVAGDFIPTGNDVVDRIATASGARFMFGGSDAANVREGRGGRVTVRFPMPEDFDSPEARIRTTLHEMGHFSGQDGRRELHGLDPFAMMMMDIFGPPRGYVKEELIAETIAVLLQDRAGILTDEAADYSSAYMGGYLTAVPEDERAALLDSVRSDAEAGAAWLLERAGLS